MKRSHRAVCQALLLAPILLAGCGWWWEEEEASEEIPLADAVVDVDGEPVASGNLELQLNVGDRFPLLKSIVQELHQTSADQPAVSRSQVDLLLSLTVEDVREDRKLLGVQYHRVRYWQDVAGETIEYDSAASGGPVPAAVLPYSGLVENGFSFWIGPDNQILEPVGFHAFLERCVRHVPPADRQDVLTRFAEASASEGIANFIDDSIGLLPYNAGGERGSTVRVGTSWTQEQRLQHPMPLVLATRYTLKELTDRVAEIDILGNIGPATTWSAGQSQINPVSSEVTVKVRNGHAFGSCTIDRQTGLPLQSRVERHLTMAVRLADGTEFDQRKRTVTTVRAFPQQAAGAP